MLVANDWLLSMIDRFTFSRSYSWLRLSTIDCLWQSRELNYITKICILILIMNLTPAKVCYWSKCILYTFRKYNTIYCQYLFKNEQKCVVGMGGMNKYNVIHISNIHVFVCLGFHITLENFSIYGDVTFTSEGIKLWSMLGIYGHWAEWVL